MERYDKFLSRYLPQYCKNSWIGEIIIGDENGNDTRKIASLVCEGKEKIQCFVNASRLGPFRNKLETMKKSTLPYIALIDSDNFADVDYFHTANEFIQRRNLTSNFILMPSFLKPNFKFDVPENFSLYLPYDPYMICINAGNYILSRDVLFSSPPLENKTTPTPTTESSLELTNNPTNNPQDRTTAELNSKNTTTTTAEHLKNVMHECITKQLEKDKNLIDHSSACDVILFNTILLETRFPSIFIVKGLEYEHVVHDGSIYLQTRNKEKNYNEAVYKRFQSLFQHKLESPLFYVGNKDTYPPFKNGLYLEEYFMKRFFEIQPRTKRKYIPCLWTNFQIESWFGSKKGEMQGKLLEWARNYYNAQGYFTVIQYDDASLLTLPPNTVVYGACSGNVPIPLIYEDKNNTLTQVPKMSFAEKTIFCSFVGSMTSNHVQPNVRMEMKKLASENFHLYFTDAWTPTVSEKNKNIFIDITSKSKFALAPRGYGRSSFRFFEILQLGVIPVYIWNDQIWLPFYDREVMIGGNVTKINYDEFCIVMHVSQLHTLNETLLSIDEAKYQQMQANYQKYQPLFTLEGMTQEIIRQVQ